MMSDVGWHVNKTCDDCWQFNPPPNMILSIPPPPPMPTLFANSFLIIGNRSAAPCPLLCDWTTGRGIEMKEELWHTGSKEANVLYLWTISLFSLLLFLGFGLTLLVFKWRQNQNVKSCLHKTMATKRTITTYNDGIYESIMYPSIKDNHVLWATMTTKGKAQTVAVTTIPPPLPPRSTMLPPPLVRSFENNAFADVDGYLNAVDKKYGKRFVCAKRGAVVRATTTIPSLNFYPNLEDPHNYPLL